MKKILLSTLILSTLSFAEESEMSFLKSELTMMKKKIERLEATEDKIKKPKGIVVKSKVPVLKFSGTHYLGFLHGTNANGDTDNRFETRRNYLQAKAYMKEHPKDYMRITLDTFNDSSGQSGVRLKYAFLYIDDILPNTGIELGQTHRPWIDYEEHNAWKYRSISKVLVEDSNAEHLTNSADRGINLKTKVKYFSSELGVFNGEGYHNIDNNLVDDSALSEEWRLTAHILGTGQQKGKRELEYANLSFFGQQNPKSAKHGNEDLNWMGLHFVYNQPAFLFSAQYVDVTKASDVYKGAGYSVNGEYRFAPKWNLIGRYDYFDLADNTGERKRVIAGITYEYNRNVEFIANYLSETGSKIDTYDFDGKRKVLEDAFMLTAQVEW